MKVNVPVRAGGVQCTMIELSECHARILRGSPLRAGSETALIFDWGESWFVATARVVSTDANGECELQFVHVPPNSKETLDAALKTLKDDRLYQSIGHIVGDALGGGVADREMLRFRFIAGKWIVRTAKANEMQPVDGFLAPASASEASVKRLCAAYENLDNDGRQMLRLLAAVKLAA